MNGINFRRRMLMGAAHYNASFGLNNYLTIEALEDNLTVTFTNTIEYTIDGREWIRLKAKNKTRPINIGQTLSFRGELTPNSSTGIGTFTINKKCNLKGNCMSMLFGDNAANNYSLSGKNYAFYKLFYRCTNIVNVDSNFLPATTLADYCYNKMFMGCSSLTTAPELPATTLTQESYDCMFSDCTSLVNAPKLSAINLAAYSMCNMFNGCTSLVNGPELLATALIHYCYYGMFTNCASLKNIRCHAKKVDGQFNYHMTGDWLYGVSSSGTFYGHSEYGWDSGGSGIPSGWTFVELTD